MKFLDRFKTKVSPAANGEMETKKATSYDYVNQVLPAPQNYQCEVLRELLRHYKKGCSVHYLRNITGIVNVSQQVLFLRRRGLEISTTETKTKNKHGRTVRYGVYHLADFKDGVKMYTDLNIKKGKKNA